MALVLAATIFLPLIGGVVLLCLPRLGRDVSRATALGVVTATLFLTLLLLGGFQTDVEGPQFATLSADGHYGVSWVEVGDGPGIRFAIGLDGISLFLFGLTSLLMLTAVCSSWQSIEDKAPTYYALLLFLQGGLLGLFASLDVVLFYVFFEFTLLPLFFIVGVYGGPERKRASVMFFLYTLAGSLLTLLGVIGLIATYYHYTDPHVLTFSIPELTEGLSTLAADDWRQVLRWGESDSLFGFLVQPQVAIFLLLFAGFAIKVPMFPFHTWLPLAHVEAPTAGSVLLAGVLLKVGGYGLLRFNLGMTPDGAAALFPMLAVLSVTGILYGAFTALAQSDVKRLVAYSSVSHMGYVALGLFSMTMVSVDGAVIQMINHGLTTGALFAAIGVLYERYHTREMSRLGGLWARLPLLAFFFILAALGSAAVPGLNGFVGEFPILAGSFAVSPLAAVFGAIGVILGAYYLLWMLQRMLFGPLKEPEEHDRPGHEASGDRAVAHRIPPVRWYEITGLAPLIALIVIIGVYPKPIFDRVSPAVETIVARFPARSSAAPSPTSENAEPLAHATRTAPTPPSKPLALGDLQDPPR